MSVYFWKRTKTLVQPSACITVALDSGQLTFIFQGTDENQITMLAQAMEMPHYRELQDKAYKKFVATIGAQIISNIDKKGGQTK